MCIRDRLNTSYHIYIEAQCRAAAVAQGVIQTGKWVQNILESRRMIYERMRVSEEMNPRFFEEHAVPGAWNESGGYFNIESGKHRAAYLLHRNRLFIPICISSNDYKKYLNIKAAAVLQAYFDSEQLSQLPYPVWHPYFYNTPFEVGSNYYEVLRVLSLKVAHYFGERQKAKRIKNLSILNLSHNLEGLVQGLAKLGCKISTSYVAKKFDLLVRRLYHLPEIGIYNEQDGFDIILGESVEQVQEYEASLYCVRICGNREIIGDDFDALLRMGDDIFAIKVKDDFDV